MNRQLHVSSKLFIEASDHELHTSYIDGVHVKAFKVGHPSYIDHDF